MADARVADLARLDRDVARAAAQLEAAREGDDPFAGVRHVAGQSTYMALAELSPSAHEVPLRDALRRWVYALTQARILRELDVAWAEAAGVAVGRFDGEEPRLVSWRDAWRGLVAARTAEEGRRWLDAAADAAPRLAAIARERAARRAEVARRMGVDEGRGKLAAGARALLEATEDVAAAARKEGAARGLVGPAGVVLDAVVRDAPDGWPARLSSRWLDGVLGPLAKGLTLRLAPLPSRTLGAATFARGLSSFGHALRVAAGASSGLPFALARDPQFTGAHTTAFVVAALAASPDFHRLALGTSRGKALGQARALARAALFDARLHAARLLLGDPYAFAPAHVFEELTARVFGAPLAPVLAGAWPATRDDEPSRFAALLAAPSLGRELVERFDVDWWRNPRAAEHLRARGGAPAHAPSVEGEDPVAAAGALGRDLEEAFG